MFNELSCISPHITITHSILFKLHLIAAWMDTNAAPHFSLPPPTDSKNVARTHVKIIKYIKRREKINEKTISNLSLATCTNVDHFTWHRTTTCVCILSRWSAEKNIGSMLTRIILNDNNLFAYLHVYICTYAIPFNNCLFTYLQIVSFFVFFLCHDYHLLLRLSMHTYKDVWVWLLFA